MMPFVRPIYYQTSFQAIEVYKKACNDPATDLTITSSGNVRLATLFERAAHSIYDFLGTCSPEQRREKAKQVIKEKFASEIDTLTKKSMKNIAATMDTVVDDLISSKNLNQLSSTINKSEVASSLAYLKELHSKKYSEEHTRIAWRATQELFASRRDVTDENQTQEAALAMRVADLYLAWKTEPHLGERAAYRLAFNAAVLMDKYDLNDSAARQVLALSGRLQSRLGIDKDLSLQMALAFQEQPDQLNFDAEELFKTCVKTTFAVNENTADQIMQKASLLKKNDQLNFLSTTQLLEISKLIVAKNKPQNEAVLISLEAGILKRDALVNRDELLAEKGRLLDQKIKQDFESLLPAGWPDAWELLPNGSRRLKESEFFQNEYIEFVTDSFEKTTINEAEGLAKEFLADAGRSKFKFGEGKNGVKVDTDDIQVKNQLRSLVPDPEARKNLSRALFQAGGNGFVAAMTLGLSQSETKRFLPLSLNLRGSSMNAATEQWISVQRTDNNKIRVGYTVFMKHFSLSNITDGSQIPINPNHDPSAPSSADDHTAKATSLIEFDLEQLNKGITDPQWVRKPELTLLIELDRTSHINNLLATKLEDLP